MPRCLGLYEASNDQCDGDRDGATDAERMPCVYRDRCAGFAKLKETSGRQPEWFVRPVKIDGREYLVANRPDEFPGELNEVIASFGIRNGRVTQRKPKKLRPRANFKREASGVRRKPLKAVQRLGNKARLRSLKEGRRVSTSLAQWCMKQLSRRSGHRVAEVEEVARPGDLYLIDRIETSGYVSVYLKLPARKRVAICCLKFKPTTRKLEVRVSLEADSFGAFVAAPDWAKLDPKPVADGAFVLRMRNVDRERATIISASLGRALKHGAFGGIE